MALQCVDFYQFYLPSIDGNELFVGEGRECAYGVAGGHVRQVGQVLATQVDGQGASVLLHAVALFQEEQRLGQASADMLLREVDGARRPTAPHLGQIPG